MSNNISYPQEDYPQPSNSQQSGYSQLSGSYSYNQNPYRLSAQIVEHPNTNLVFVLGIVGLFFSFVAPFAWYYGSKARREIAENPGKYESSSMLTAGYVLGIVVSIMLIIAIVLCVAGIILFTMAVISQR